MKTRRLIVFILIFLVLFTLIGCTNTKKCADGKHNAKWVVTIEPSCTQLGLKELKCEKCNEVLTSAKIDYTDHNVVIDSKKDATCEEKGLTEGSHCSVCNTVIVKQDEIDAIGHNYVLDSSLSNQTTLVYKCEYCGDTYNKEVNGSCTNHSSSDWIITEEATCEKSGSKHKICENCGVELQVQTIAMLKHIEETIKGIDATCTEDGLTDGSKCETCGKVITEQQIIEALGHSYVITDTLAPTTNTKGYIEYTCSVCKDSYKQEITDLGSYDATQPTVILLSDKGITISNNNGGVLINNKDVTINLAGEYDLVGTISEGSVTVSLQETDKAIINLRGVNITSSLKDPIFIESGDKVEISAKSDTKNYIYDKRAISDTAVGAAIYSKIDLEIKGKGELNIESTYNNGIGSTKDLEIKNLVLNVNVPNNALKGNDSITIESGTIKAISSSGDSLKTENSDISDKGNQRGIITINDGTLDLYAACDGIDASYDVVINGGTINVFTEKYSEYSGEVTVTQSSTLYLRISSRAGLQGSYKYSAKFTDDNNNVTWVNFTTNDNRIYQLSKPATAKYLTVYCYNSTQTQGQENNYAFKSDQLTIPTTFDQYYVRSASSNMLSGEWQNYSTSQQGPGGRPGGGGMGGPNEGNSNKADYSCKGIKADNGIIINGGTINIKSHDDAIHTNSDVLLDTGSYGKANLIIKGGNINIYSDDDALHADGNLTIDGGNIIITNSYEGVEGNNIYFNNGTVQIKSSDDGLNAKSSLNFAGGIVYLDAGGDGVDSNGTATMTGGVVLALGPSNGGNGVIDFDRSFSFSGGLFLAIGCNGMNQKPTATSGNTSISKSISTNTSSYVTVTVNNEVVAVIKVTKSSQNYCVLAYNNSAYPNAQANVTTSNSKTLVNGLYYVK